MERNIFKGMGWDGNVCLEFLFASHFTAGPRVANLIVSLRSFQVFICFAIYGICAYNLIFFIVSRKCASVVIELAFAYFSCFLYEINL